MEKIINGLVKGLLIGLCIGFVLSALVGCEATANCVEEWIGAFFGCGSCSDGCGDYWGDKSVQNCYLYASLISAVVGGVYGAIKEMQARDEDKRKQAAAEVASSQEQRRNWASEIRKEAFRTSETCKTSASASMGDIVSTASKAEGMMYQIALSLTRVAEFQGKIVAFAEEIEQERKELQ